jgi:hypothetical protein
LILRNNILAQKLRGWTCGENESCSDHNLIRFDIETETTNCHAGDLSWKRYHIKTEDWVKFENKLSSNLLTVFGYVNNSGDHAKCDVELGKEVKKSTDTEKHVSTFSSLITASCDTGFKVSRTRDCDTKGRSVSWWSSELTVLRKRTLALRRSYQRLGTMTTCDKRESSGTRRGRVYQTKL